MRIVVLTTTLVVLSACTLISGAGDLRSETNNELAATSSSGTTTSSSSSSGTPPPPDTAASSSGTTTSSSSSSSSSSGTSSSSSTSSGNPMQDAGPLPCVDKTYGPRFPNMVAGDLWSSANAARADDGRIAHGGESEGPLVARSFNLNVPATAQIKGIELKIARSSFAPSIRDKVVQLSKGVSRAKTTDNWPVDQAETNFPKTSYGSATDLWGAQWSGADINSIEVTLSVTGFGDGHVDSFALTVYTCE
jgi:hypothetical protein